MNCVGCTFAAYVYFWGFKIGALKLGLLGVQPVSRILITIYEIPTMNDGRACHFLTHPPFLGR